MRWVAFCLLLAFSGPALSQSFQDSAGAEVFVTQECLAGEGNDVMATFVPLPDPSVCTVTGACSVQQATSQIITYLEACQGGLVWACISQQGDGSCLLDLQQQFDADAVSMRTQIADRLNNYDVSKLPPLLRRRLSDPARLTPAVSCSSAAADYYGVDAKLFCGVGTASEARLAALRAQYALDKAGVPR